MTLTASLYLHFCCIIIQRCRVCLSSLNNHFTYKVGFPDSNVVFACDGIYKLWRKAQ